MTDERATAPCDFFFGYLVITMSLSTNDLGPDKTTLGVKKKKNTTQNTPHG